MLKILITGGAGYKGTLLAEALLAQGHHVTILDNFMYGFDPVLGFASHPRCQIRRKDIRSLEEADVKDFDLIYHLAAISGYPACEANPHSAQTINVESTRGLVKLLSPRQVLVYASTTSLYGRSEVSQDETTTPQPQSLYGLTKLEAETICMQRERSVSLRFATLFGASRKMRCDLLFNDFVYKAVTERSLVLFDAASVRTFLHVSDAIRAYAMIPGLLDQMVGLIFNVGTNSMNHSKRELAEMIQELMPLEIIETRLEDLDRRNFVINYDRITRLGFAPSVSMAEGVRELVQLYSWYRPFLSYKTI